MKKAYTLTNVPEARHHMGSWSSCHSELVSESCNSGGGQIPQQVRDDKIVNSLPSCPPAFRTSKKVAFTLAEVLITLAIIGVVAAMTIPTLISKYNKQQTVVKLKKAYSELSQAIKLSEIDNGPLQTWNYETAFNGEDASDFLDKYIVPYVKTIKNCRNKSGCMSADVYSLSDVKNGFYTGSQTAHIILSSGSVVGLTLGGNYASIQVVINNKKDKIYIGKDIFFFGLNYRNNGKFFTSGEHLTDSELLDDNYGCNQKETDGAGMGCTTVILRNGWNVPEDYPVKF